MDTSGLLPLATLFLLGTGAWFLGWVLVHAARARRAASWPTAPGTVIEASLDQRHNPNGPGYYYGAKIRYEYVVDGCRYECDTVAFGELYSRLRVEAQERLERYPVGARVAVRYDPCQPEVATLVSQARVDNLVLMLVIAAIFFGAGAYTLTL